MRLLILSNLYPPNVVGGYERLCFEVTSALATRGYEITVLTSDYGGRTEEIAGQTVLREWTLLAGEHIYAPFTGDREAVNEHNSAVLTRTLANVKPDIVFSWNLFFLDAGILQQLETCGVRTVVMLTDNWLLNMRNPPFWPRYWQEHVIGNAAFNPPPARPPLPAYKRLAARLLRRPLGLEAIFGAAYVRDFYAAGGVTFPVYRVIHNGVRQPVSAASPALDRTKLVTPGILRLLFAGRMVDVKGPDLCVDMLSHLAVDGLRVELTLLGDMQNAEYAVYLRTRVEASGFREPHHCVRACNRGGPPGAVRRARHLFVSVALRAVLADPNPRPVGRHSHRRQPRRR